MIMKQNILKRPAMNVFNREKFSGIKVLGRIFLVIVLAFLLDSACICVAAAQSQDSSVSITTTQPMEETPLSISVNTEEEYTLKWYVDKKKVSTAESYTPTASDYEKWIKVVMTSVDSGAVLGEDSIYFSKLPVVYINTDDGTSITTKTYKTADLDIQGNSQYTAQYSGDMTVKVRGNSSAFYPQRPYKIKLNTSTNLFGMGKSKHWVLISNYMDQCGLRNMLGSSLSKQLGLVNMDMVYVDVVINGKYAGFYELTEHIRIDDNRVNIYNWEDEAESIAKKIYKGNTDILSKDDQDALEDQLCEDLSWITSNQVTYKDVTYSIGDYYTVSDNLSGGYLFEMSEEYDEVSKFTTSGGLKVMVNSPEYIYTCDSIMNDLRGYWQDFEDAIQSKDGYNGSSVHYSGIADFDSMVSYWLTMEILGNDDAFWKSRFAYKDMDGLLTFGPAWDFDCGCGSYTVGTSSTGWKVSIGTLWKDFIDDPYFQVKASEKYWEIRAYLESLIEDGGFIDRTVEYLSEAGLLSDKKYSATLYAGFTRRTFHTDASIFKTYLKERIAWLDQVFATEETTTDAMKIGNSTNPYTKSSEQLAVTLVDTMEDILSTNAPADGLIKSGNPVEVCVAVLDTNTTKIAVYVNGLIQNTYDVTDTVCAFSVPEESLTEEMGTKNVISIIGYNTSDKVTYTNYASVIVVPDSYISGTPYVIKDEKLIYDVNMPHILINQAYGGSSDGYASHDFIELYNTTDIDIDVSSWSLQYRSSNDGDDRSAWSKLDLTGIIPAHSSYLVRCSRIASPNKNAITINNYDQEWNHAIHSKGISILLMANQILLDAETDIYDNSKHIPLVSDYVDMYSISGDDTDSEEKITKQKAPYSENAASAVQSKKKTIRRLAFTDTDDNMVGGDFEVIDYSFDVDSYIDWISPRCSSDGAWNYESNVRPTYSVVYECGEGSSAVLAEEYGLYETIRKPENPVKEGYVLDGWYTEEEYINEYDFESQEPPTGDITLYTKWIADTYHVTYESNGGSVLPDDVYAYGTDVLPVNPTREGYTFTNWYEDEKLTRIYTFGKMPAKDIKLYAGWIKNVYKVIYVDKDGTVINIQEIAHGDSAVVPAAPKHAGYTFSGWTTKANCVTGNLIIIATYQKIETSLSLSASYKKAVANKKAKAVTTKNVTSITLYTKKLKTAQLSVIGTKHSVIWSSSNQSVAKVSKKGKVTAVGKGTAYITAKVDGVSCRCKITVKKAQIVFAQKTASVVMQLGAKQSVGASVVPLGAVTYKTSNKRVVSITKKGIMKAKAVGTATITVKANGLKKKLKVIVRKV